MPETFVLIHGAWHGAWCWTGVMAELERMGHRVYALDLPGRWSSPMPHAKINRHVWVETVVKSIEQHDLRNVVLVGHSMGGVTITGVSLKIPRRLKRVIYVTALVPPEEGSLADEFPRLLTPAFANAMRQIDGGVSTTMDSDYFRSNFIQDASRDLQDFVYAALVPEAMPPMNDPVPMREFHALGLPTSYVICEDDLVWGDPKVWHPGFSSRLLNPTTRSLTGGHELMFTKPVTTAHALVELARD
jgi:pimeloyl-ACP methyl ester carboxylesterase